MCDDGQMSFDFGANSPPKGRYPWSGSDIFCDIQSGLPNPDTFHDMSPYELDETYHFVMSQLGRKGVFTVKQRDYLRHYLWAAEDILLQEGLI